MEIKIEQGYLDYLEVLTFQDKSFFRLLKYLTAQNSTKQEWIDYYTQEYLKNAKELEILKQEIIKIYSPASQNFKVNFEKGVIIFDTE